MTRPIADLDVPLPTLSDRIAATDQNPNLTRRGDAVTENPTCIAGTTIGLGDDHEWVRLDTRDGHLTISLAPGIQIVCDHADQATLDKLATITANAATVNRSRALREVA
ncbi:hypothetical protein ACFY2M_19610 [Streptomyces sp. NPDC001276]|uniref:hypothetical protein n=1 Tax=Streptomyces sp. NPDC001276 TaxID=3364555 RepID=UPI0036AFEB9A